MNNFYLLTLAIVAFLRNGLINMMQAFKMGPIFTTWITHSFTGRLSSFAAPTLQFRGMSHFRIDELRPLQSAMADIPFCCVNGSLSNICIKISSNSDASVNSVFGPIFPAIKNRMNDYFRKTELKRLNFYLIWRRQRSGHIYHAYRAPFVYLNSICRYIRIYFCQHELMDCHAKIKSKYSVFLFRKKQTKISSNFNDFLKSFTFNL